MLKNKQYFFCFFLCISSLYVYSQRDFNILNSNNVKELRAQEATPLDKVKYDSLIPYDYVNERDILWSKMTWEYIDLKEKINMPFYYPVDSMNVETERKCLFDAIIIGIHNRKITEIYDDSFFRNKMSVKQVEAKMTRIDTSDYAKELMNQGVSDVSQYIDKIRIQAQDIKGYSIRGIWYIDKKHAELRYRLIGIAPVAADVQTLGKEGISGNENLPLFWIFYKDARKVLHFYKVFTPNNRHSTVSFDDLLNARRFRTSVVREENIFGNRAVSDYIKDKYQKRFESDRIREIIRNTELDLWNY